MTVYETHEDFVRDELNSYRSAKMHVKRLLKDAERDLLPDYRGDRDKIIEALEAGIRYLDALRTDFARKNKFVS
jgi:hypothetical protein